MRALTPLLEKFVPPEVDRDFNGSVANLQLAYVEATSEETPGQRAEEPDGGG